MDRFCTSWSGSSPADQHLVSVFYGVELQSLLVAVDLKLCPDHLHTDMGQNMSEQATATAPVRSSSFKMKSRIFTDTQRTGEVRLGSPSGWCRTAAGLQQEPSAVCTAGPSPSGPAWTLHSRKHRSTQPDQNSTFC